MIFYTCVGKTKHYIEFHEKEFPFDEVKKRIRDCKRFRKKGDKFVIIGRNHYILCESRENTIFVINAKRK